MKKILIPALCLSASLIYSSCDTQPSSKGKPEAMASVNSQKDVKIEAEEFVQKAYKGNMMEVEMGKMAQEKATNKEVQKFAKRMVKDHGKANKDLSKIIDNKNIVVAESLDAEAMEKMDLLQDMSGMEFDKSYMEKMVQEHKMDVELYQTAIEDINDDAINKYAKSTLKVLQEHLNLAQNINQMLQETPTAKGNE